MYANNAHIDFHDNKGHNFFFQKFVFSNCDFLNQQQTMMFLFLDQLDRLIFLLLVIVFYWWPRTFFGNI